MYILDFKIALVHCNNNITISSNIVCIMQLPTIAPVQDDINIVYLKTYTTRGFNEVYSRWGPVWLHPHWQILKNIFLFVQIQQIINVLESPVSVPFTTKSRFKDIVYPNLNNIYLFIHFIEFRMNQFEHCSCPLGYFLHVSCHKEIAHSLWLCT